MFNKRHGIFSSQNRVVQTSAPSIQFAGATTNDFFSFIFSWRVTNTDSSTATVVSNFEINPPTGNGVSLTTNSQSTIRSSGTVNNSSGVIYARATASGKTASSITSLFVSA